MSGHCAGSGTGAAFPCAYASTKTSNWAVNVSNPNGLASKLTYDPTVPLVLIASANESRDEVYDGATNPAVTPKGGWRRALYPDEIPHLHKRKLPRARDDIGRPAPVAVVVRPADRSRIRLTRVEQVVVVADRQLQALPTAERGRHEVARLRTVPKPRVLRVPRVRIHRRRVHPKDRTVIQHRCY
jgi:hypothetical protein